MMWAVFFFLQREELLKIVKTVVQAKDPLTVDTDLLAKNIIELVIEPFTYI